MKPTLDPIPMFLQHFRVVTETSAYFDVTYDREKKTFGYAEPDVSDTTNAVQVYDRRAESNDSIEPLILDIRKSHESLVIEDLSELFASVAGDINVFIKEAQRQY